jgi:hypothetical protein
VADLPPNAFEVFSSAQADHENQLTRALLVLLRLSPAAHQVWLREIGLANEGLTQLGEPTFAFQTGQLPAIEPESEGVRGISVFITRSDPTNRGPIVASDRRQIPDGLTYYPGTDQPVIVVVESKVRGDADATQAREINLGPIKASWDPPNPVELRWARLIDELWTLIDLDLASATERRLLLDFFDYVDNRYRQVGPFSTLRRCAGVHERVLRRCRTLLAEATDLQAHDPIRGLGPHVELEDQTKVARRVYLDPNQVPGELRLSFWPADTPNQARALYGDPAMCHRLLDLGREEGWGLDANMHFGHFQPGFAWTDVPMSADDYIVFWQGNTDLIGTVYRPGTHANDWDSLLEELLEQGVISSREPFDRDFTQTNRTKADVRPGFQIFRMWSMEEATALDDTDALLAQVRYAYEEATQAISGIAAG